MSLCTDAHSDTEGTILLCHKYITRSHIILYLKQGHGEPMISEWKKQIIYKGTLILIVASVIVYILNIIVVNQYLQEIRTEGINYELFREMKISNELFDQVVSMTDGVVEKKGWLEQGAYKIGIRSKSGAYFYYAHLESYADELEVGDFIESGDFLG